MTVKPMEKSLDRKLANIHADPSGATDFILADAKDADMAAGMAAPGKDVRTGKMRSLAEYRDQMREVTRQGLVDIMLMSCSTSEELTIQIGSTRLNSSHSQISYAVFCLK